MAAAVWQWPVAVQWRLVAVAHQESEERERMSERKKVRGREKNREKGPQLGFKKRERV